MLFVSMEIELRRHLHVSATPTEDKEAIIDKLMTSDTVQSHWNILGCNWDEASDELLKLIVEHWITIRGFSSVNAFLEMYKQQNKCTIDKSKALRKKLTTDQAQTMEEN